MRARLTTCALIVALAVLAVAAPVIVTGQGRDRAAAQGSGQTVDLEAISLTFRPAELTVGQGDVLAITNKSVLEHNFAIDGYDMAPVDLPNDGTTVNWTVPDDLAPGMYTFYCAVPGHRASGMYGTLTVLAGSGEPEASDQPSTAESTPAPSGSSASRSSPAAGASPSSEDPIGTLEARSDAQATQITDLQTRVAVLEDGGGRRSDATETPTPQG